MISYSKIKESDEYINSKQIHKGLSENGYTRKIVKISCEWCGEKVWTQLKNYKNGDENFCSNSHKSKYYNTGRDQSGTKNGAYVGKIDFIKSYKEENNCKRCGEERPACLIFHHKQPENKVENVSTMRYSGSYTLQDIKNEVEKCEILCANCHRLEHKQ